MVQSSNPSTWANITQGKRAWAFARCHGWAMPRYTGLSATQYRTIVCQESAGPRAYLDPNGTLSTSPDSPIIEVWWRLPGEPVQRTEDTANVRTRRLGTSQAILTTWTQDSLQFEQRTQALLLDGVRLVWHHLKVRLDSEAPAPRQIQIIAALRPFSRSHGAVLPDLRYHTGGTFLTDGRVLLHDPAAAVDGIRLSNAAQGDTLRVMEGTVPPEGGLSIRDLREKSLSIRCPLGLCSGVTSTFTELAPGGMFERWWVVPLDTLSLADLPLHLLSAEWNRRVLESLEESSTAYPRHPGEPARKFLISRLAEAARGDGGPNGVQLPSSLDLPILMEAAHHCACPTHGWEILYRWMLRQGDDGLLVHRQQEPLMATAGWLAATMIHLQRHPIHTGTRSPFPPSHNWARSIRLAILSAGLEIRRRSREGWLAARYDMLCGTGHEHWAMARLILATRLMAELRDVTITHEEATALLRVHAELRQVLSHSIARSLEHAPRGLVPPGYGIPFASSSARTVDALLDLSPEERPVSESVLRATARALYRLTSGTPDGILQAPMDEDSATISASPLLTLYLVRILRRLGHGDEARELMKRLIQTSCDLDGGEWPGEELGATALSVLMAG